MSSVESRIVTMKFNNSQFMSGVSATIAALGKLKSSMGMKDAAKGIDEVNAKASRFNLNGMTNAAQGVSKSFLAMSTVAITALANVANRAVNAGINIIKSLTITPVMDGFREYELGIKSIQTILANTKAEGTNLKQVNAALDELNTYADKTIYNFAEMTRNIGTFTAAGVDLKTSTQSIKGIANLAAISGSTSQQASTAMYQLSQAISAGSVKLMDWNSVVNAGMGGRVFQEALFETGKAMGKITDVPINTTFKEWTKAGNTFRGSLEKGWVTSEVLTTTLQGFTGEMSKAELRAKGFTEAQIKNIQDMGETGVDAATKVRTLTQLFDTAKEAVASGWSQSFRTIIGDFNEATELFTKISGAFDDVVSKSSDARNKILDDWKAEGGRDAIIKGFKVAFKSLGDIIGVVREQFRDIFPPVTGKRLAELSKGFRDLMKRLKPSEETLEKIGRVARGVFSIFAVGVKVVKAVAGFFKNLLLAIFGGGTGFLDLAAKVGDFFTKLNDGIPAFKLFEGATNRVGDAVRGIGPLFERILNFIQPLIDGFKEFGSEAKESITNAFTDFNWANLFRGISAGALVGLTGVVAKIAKSFKSLVKNGIGVDLTGGIKDSVVKSLETFTGVLQGMQANLKANALLKIAGAIAILVAAIAVLAFIDAGALTKSVAAISAGFTVLIGAFAAMDRIVADPKSAAKLTGLASGLIALAGAMLILSVAIKILSTLEWSELAKGLIGIGVGLAVMTKATDTLTKNYKGMIRAGVGLILVSTALLIMSVAIKRMADIPWNEMINGIGGIGLALATVAGAMRLMPKGMVLQAAALVILSSALLIMSKAIKDFPAVDEAAKQLLAIGAALVVIGAAMRFMPKNMIVTAAGMVVLSYALREIAKAVETFAGMTIEELAKGLISLAVALGIIAGALKLMSSALPGAAVLLVAAAALRVFIPVLQILANMSIAQLVTSLIALAAALGLIAGAAALMGAAAPLLLAGGGALLLVAAGLALIGLAAMAFAQAVKIVAEALQILSNVAGETFDRIIKYIPEIIKSFGQGVVEFIKVIGNSHKEFVKAISAVLAAVLDAIAKNVPKMQKVFGRLLDAAIDTIVKYIPKIMTMGIRLIVNFMKAIRDNLPKILKLAIDIIVTFIRGLQSYVDRVIPEGVRLVVKIINGVSNSLDKITRAATNLVVRFINGMANNYYRILNAGVNFVIKLVRGVGDAGYRIADAGFKAIIKFINGMTRAVNQNSGELRTAGINLAKAIADGFTGGMASRVSGLINSVRGAIGSAIDGAKRLLGIRSPSRVFAEIGQQTGQGFIVGLDSVQSEVSDSAASVGMAARDALKKSMAHLESEIDNDIEIKPVITPVLDLEKVKKDASGLTKAIGRVPVSPQVSAYRAYDISSTQDYMRQDWDGKGGRGDIKLEFTQTNNSPEALSAVEIYRQTRNQLSLAKEALSL